MNHIGCNALNNEPAVPKLPTNRTSGGLGKTDAIDPQRTPQFSETTFIAQRRDVTYAMRRFQKAHTELAATHWQPKS